MFDTIFIVTFKDSRGSYHTINSQTMLPSQSQDQFQTRKRGVSTKSFYNSISKTQRFLTAPQTGIWFWTWITTLVVIINIVLTVSATFIFPEAAGLRKMYQGNCSKVKNLDTALTIVINMLSILLLTGSNYTMQYLSSPIRTELDRAHSRGRWLDIGVPTMRNLLWIDR